MISFWLREKADCILGEQEKVARIWSFKTTNLKENSKEICDEISFSSFFQKNVTAHEKRTTLLSCPFAWLKPACLHTFVIHS